MSGPARAQEPSLEVAVKASYLYKFAPFVQWPASAIGGPTSPFAICVVGDDPFGPVLDRAVAGQRVEGRPIVIHRLDKADRQSPCQVMYIGGPSSRVKDVLQTMHGAPVLTVTDGPVAPGIVDFATEGGKVRFRIDDQTAAEDGLTISSKLLSLAVAVKARNGAGGGQ